MLIPKNPYCVIRFAGMRQLLILLLLHRPNAAVAMISPDIARAGELDRTGILRQGQTESEPAASTELRQNTLMDGRSGRDKKDSAAASFPSGQFSRNAAETCSGRSFRAPVIPPAMTAESTHPGPGIPEQILPRQSEPSGHVIGRKAPW